MASFDYDVVIVGSGFGGSVAALRAAEKGYRVGVMESGRRWKDEDIPKTQWDLPHFLWQPEGCTGFKGSSTSTTCSSSPAQAWAAAPKCMRTPCMSPRSSSSTPRSGRGSPTGPTNWRRVSTRQPNARRRSLPVHAYRCRSIHTAGRDRDRQRAHVQQGASGRLLRQPGRRGRRSVLRRGRAAPHRLHLMRQLQHRVRSQRQEQADDELSVPRRKAGRRDPSAARGIRARPARWRRIRGAHAASRLGAASGASSPPYVHRRASDCRGTRIRLGEASSAHAAQRSAARPLERAGPTSADELRTAPFHHADPRAVGARSGKDPHHARVDRDHLRRLAGRGDEH